MQQHHSKKQRPLPTTGGGSPIISASGRISNPGRPTTTGAITLVLTTDAKSEAAGREIVERVRAACASDNFEVLSTLLVLFPEVVPRVAEFHGLMNELVREGHMETIRRICRIPGSQGRRHGDPFYFVAAVERVMAEQKLARVTHAIAWIADAFEKARERGELGLPWLPSRKTLQNQHAAFGELFRIWSGSRSVPGEILVALPWWPPGYRPEPSIWVETKLSNAIVFHSPRDRVSEPNE